MSEPPADPHLPAVHLRPPRNWINDPNGLAYHDGHYHVFFQHNPHGPQHGDIHWGHFRSPDLVHWEQLPDALAPTPGGYDADGCYSGNAVSDGERFVAFYSANRAGCWWQPIAAAESRDGGRTWTKRPRLLIPEPPAGTTMYRDPYVWRHEGAWRMLVGAALADGHAAALLYQADDLEHWQYQGPFLTSSPFPASATDAPGDAESGGSGWECPQYATFGAHGVLIVSDWDARRGPRGVLAFAGRAQHGRFEAGRPVLLDHGPDFYAPALLHAPDGRWLLWGWAREARDGDWVNQAGWSGVLTLPRELTLAGDGSVCQRPARELLALRTRRTLRRSTQIAPEQPRDLGEVSRTCHITVVLHPDGPTSAGLRLITSSGGDEYLDISLDLAAGRLVADRARASRDPRAKTGAYTMPCPAASAPGTAVEIHLVVDRSIIEIYLPTGQTLTLRFYPTGDAPWRLQARTTGARCGFVVEAWDLSPDGIRDELLPVPEGVHRD